MNYTKPEVAVLGEAVRMIEVVGQPKISGSLDPDQKHSPNPAYDLDE